MWCAAKREYAGVIGEVIFFFSQCQRLKVLPFELSGSRFC
jgi:hypothetical protein